MQPKQFIGIVGISTCACLFIKYPSWPSPDKLLVVFFFIFMTMKDTKEGLLKFGPFVILLLVYESLRGWAAPTDTSPAGPTHYDWPVAVDKLIGFGELPTVRLQAILWQGSVSIIDKLFYITYMLHFLLPFSLGLLIWKKRGSAEFWQYISTLLLVSFGGFLTFWLMPVAPPWLAAEHGVIQNITHVSGEIWGALGLKDFPTVYSKISPNPVAAVPSLHAAYATLLTIFIFKNFGRKWGKFSLIYLGLIYLGTVCMGEHYLIDEIIGSIYALVGYLVVSKNLTKVTIFANKLITTVKSRFDKNK